MFKGGYNTNIEVTCITHRKDPLFVTHLVGFMAQDCNIELELINEATMYRHLNEKCGFAVTDVAFHQSGGGMDYCVIQMKKRFPFDPWQAMYAALASRPWGLKMLVTVDEDIDPRDPDLVNWALTFSMQPHKDVRIIPDRGTILDPSAFPPGRENETRSSTSSTMLIDATRKWPFPPVGLPRREFMTNAINIWKELDFPELKLKPPWHGYELGNWTAEDREYADLIVRGEFFAVGDKLAQKGRKV
jgi:4-hydroxy-3-polyprenylbenzoate decarboxylase